MGVKREACLSAPVDESRIARDLGALSLIGRTSDNSLTRLAYTEAGDEAFEYLVSQSRAIGLNTYRDSFGNLYSMAPAALGRRPVIMGSHLDTVIGGGAYDGSLGVVAALEVMRLVAGTQGLGDLPIVLAPNVFWVTQR